MLYRKKELHEGWVFRRGDIYLANLNPRKGSEQGGIRPVLVLQNNAGNFFSPTIIVAPITSRIHKADLPTHRVLGKEGGLYYNSMVELEQLRTIDKTRVTAYIGRLCRETMEEIEEAVLNSLGIVITEEMEAP